MYILIRVYMVYINTDNGNIAVVHKYQCMYLKERIIAFRRSLNSKLNANLIHVQKIYTVPQTVISTIVLRGQKSADMNANCLKL